MQKLNRTGFEKIVEEGIKAIPEKFLQKLNNVAIVVEDEPTTAQRKKLNLGQGRILFGLYEGVPQTKRWHYGQVLPDKITIFKKPIERVARSEQEIKEIVKNTVWHEIAHHFGFSEKGIKLLEEKKRIKNK